MSRLINKALDKYAAITEKALAESLHGLESSTQCRLIITARQTNATATCRALEHHRIANLFRCLHRLINILEKSGARRQRHTSLLRQCPRLMLEAKLPHLRWRWTDKNYSSLRAGFGKLRIFRQEAVSRNNSLSTGFPCRVYNRFILQIAFRCGRTTNVHGLIRFTNMHAVAVSVRIHRHTGNAHTAQSSNDADSNFTAIGNQDFS